MTEKKYTYFSTADPTKLCVEFSAGKLALDIAEISGEVGGEFVADETGTMFAIVSGDGEHTETICILQTHMEDGTVIEHEDAKKWLKSLPIDYSQY